MEETAHILRLIEAMAGFQSEGGEEMRLNGKEDQSLIMPAKEGRPIPLRCLYESYQADWSWDGGSQSEGPVFCGTPERAAWLIFWSQIGDPDLFISSNYLGLECWDSLDSLDHS